MKKILFSTEFSDHAPEVYKFAVELAYHFKADLYLLHAFGTREATTADEETIAHLADVTVDNLIKLVKGNTPETYLESVKFHYITEVGLAADAIMNTALNENIDLIVMGLTGKKNALDSLIGNTSLSVLSKSDTPVLAIPTTVTFKGIDNLVYTTNFEFRDLSAINYLHKWSKRLDAPVHCLHVIEEDENEMGVMKNMSTLRTTYKGRKWLKFDMAKGKFRKEIERFAKGKKADILVMMSHKTNFINRIIDRSSVKDIALSINLPILIIKDNAFELDNETWEWLEIVNSIG